MSLKKSFNYLNLLPTLKNLILIVFENLIKAYLDKFHSLENNESFLTDEQIMNLYQKYHEFQTSNYQYIEENIFFDNDKECSICLQNILENNRRFGLLRNEIFIL